MLCNSPGQELARVALARDANAPDVRALLEIFPIEQVGTFVQELIVQRLWRVVVNQLKRLAGLQIVERREDHRVTIARLNGTYIYLCHDPYPEK